MTEARPSLQRSKRDWPRALRALQLLLNDASQTQQAIIVVDALDGDAAEAGLRRMLREPEGRKVFAERPSLRARLTDREGLMSLPEDSLGRVYIDFMDRYALDPQKIIELYEDSDVVPRPTSDALCWYGERAQLMHDLWHVLVGYGADPLGEAALLPFSYAQQRGPGRLLLTLGATIKLMRTVGARWLLTAYRSWRRGQRAVCMEALPYESLLSLPLEEVRRLCGIEHPSFVHREEPYTTNRGALLAER